MISFNVVIIQHEDVVKFVELQSVWKTNRWVAYASHYEFNAILIKVAKLLFRFIPV